MLTKNKQRQKTHYLSILKETEIVHHFYRAAVKCRSVIAVVGEPPVFSNVIKGYLTSFSTIHLYRKILLCYFIYLVTY